jgi:hypothetical protein
MRLGLLLQDSANLLRSLSVSGEESRALQTRHPLLPAGLLHDDNRGGAVGTQDSEFPETRTGEDWTGLELEIE